MFTKIFKDGLRTVNPDGSLGMNVSSDNPEVTVSPDGDPEMDMMRDDADKMNELVNQGLPPDFNEKLSNFEFQRDSGITSYQGNLGEIRQMARGKNPEGLRKFYPGWEDGDFKSLLHDLGEEVEQDEE